MAKKCQKCPEKVFCTSLGPSGREFESPISDQQRNLFLIYIKDRFLSALFFVFTRNSKSRGLYQVLLPVHKFKSTYSLYTERHPCRLSAYHSSPKENCTAHFSLLPCSFTTLLLIWYFCFPANCFTETALCYLFNLYTRFLLPPSAITTPSSSNPFNSCLALVLLTPSSSAISALLAEI